MPAFDTFMDNVGLPGLTETFFGESGSYLSVLGGDPVPTQAVITFDVVLQPTGYDSSTVITGTVVEALIDDVGDVAEGDTFTVGATVYTCKKEIENSGKITKWVVHGD